MTKSEEMLERLKKKCLLVWEKYKDNPGDYYQEKYDRVMSCNHPDDYDYLM
jgi:predicted Zn-dependent peptidase